MLTISVTIGVILTTLLHIWFSVLEIFLWQKPFGCKTFNLDPEFARKSAALAANQGLYNLFLSAGLIWSLLANNPSEAIHLKIFFLSCIAIAGIFGAITVSYKIIFVQALPAILTLILLAICVL
jgi:putative membrane protein